jgi:hypothetical protein
MGGWKTEHSKTDFAATLMQIILVYYLWARVNQHPPTAPWWMDDKWITTHSLWPFQMSLCIWKRVPGRIFSFSFQGFIISKEIRYTGHFCKILKFEIDLYLGEGTHQAIPGIENPASSNPGRASLRSLHST